MARTPAFDRADALRGARDRFWSGSYNGTSTEDLCAATGLSRSSLYNAFTSKRALYLSALDDYAAARAGELRGYLDAPDGRSALAALLRDTLSGQLGRADRRGCLVVGAAVEIGPADPDVAAAARANMAAFRDFLAVLVRRGQRDGSLVAAGPPEALAALIYAAQVGLQVSARVAADPAQVSAAVDALLDLLGPAPDGGL